MYSTRDVFVYSVSDCRVCVCVWANFQLAGVQVQRRSVSSGGDQSNQGDSVNIRLIPFQGNRHTCLHHVVGLKTHTQSDLINKYVVQGGEISKSSWNVDGGVAVTVQLLI